MPIPLRRFYAQKLIEAKQKEAKTIKDASKNQNKISRPTFQKS
jgi:hypothetical protein